MSIYQFSVSTINGGEKSFADFEGNVLLIVNTATKCGFAPQLKELQELYNQYKDHNFVVLGFPCNQFMNQEPGSDEEVVTSCRTDFGITFPIFKKIKVKGEGAHPLYQYL